MDVEYDASSEWEAEHSSGCQGGGRTPSVCRDVTFSHWSKATHGLQEGETAVPEEMEDAQWADSPPRALPMRLGQPAAHGEVSVVPCMEQAQGQGSRNNASDRQSPARRPSWKVEAQLFGSSVESKPQRFNKPGIREVLRSEIEEAVKDTDTWRRKRVTRGGSLKPHTAWKSRAAGSMSMPNRVALAHAAHPGGLSPPGRWTQVAPVTVCDLGPGPTELQRSPVVNSPLRTAPSGLSSPGSTELQRSPHDSFSGLRPVESLLRGGLAIRQSTSMTDLTQMCSPGAHPEGSLVKTPGRFRGSSRGQGPQPRARTPSPDVVSEEQARSASSRARLARLLRFDDDDMDYMQMSRDLEFPGTQSTRGVHEGRSDHSDRTLEVGGNLLESYGIVHGAPEGRAVPIMLSRLQRGR